MSNFSSDRSVSSASLILSVSNVSVLFAKPTFGSTVSSGLKPDVHESLAKCVAALVGIHVEYANGKCLFVSLLVFPLCSTHPFCVSSPIAIGMFTPNRSFGSDTCAVEPSLSFVAKASSALMFPSLSK